MGATKLNEYRWGPKAKWIKRISKMEEILTNLVHHHDGEIGIDDDADAAEHGNARQANADEVQHARTHMHTRTHARAHTHARSLAHMHACMQVNERFMEDHHDSMATRLSATIGLVQQVVAKQHELDHQFMCTAHKMDSLVAAHGHTPSAAGLCGRRPQVCVAVGRRSRLFLVSAPVTSHGR